MSATECPDPLDCDTCGRWLRHHLRGALEAIPAARRRALVEEMIESLELFEEMKSNRFKTLPSPAAVELALEKAIPYRLTTKGKEEVEMPCRGCGRPITSCRIAGPCCPECFHS